MFGLGSSSQLGIGIAISLNNQFSGQAAKVNASLLAMRKNANAAVTGAIRDYRNQSAEIAAGAGIATMGLINMAKAGAEFDHSINQMFIVGGRELGRTRKQLSGFAQDLSKTFSREPLEIASAMFENVRQGVRGGLEDITKYQIATATATDEALGGDTGVAANLLNIMNAMDISQDHFKDVANGVTAVANSTQASVYSIGESMQYAAFTAHQFNLPLATTLALVGKLSQVGIRGTSAGTGINNMLTQMAKGLGPFQTKRQLAAWQMMGLDPKQIASMANSGNMTGVIAAVSQATKGMTAIQKGSILPQAFNMRGTRALEGLFDSKHGNKTIADILKEAEAGIKGDLVMKQSKAMMNDIFSDFKFLTNAFHRFRVSFMNAAAPTLRVLLHVASKVISFVGSIIDSPIGKVLTGIAVVVIPTIGILFAFRAALFTATLALRGMAGTAAVGGFQSLLGAGLNSIGLARFGNAGGNLTKNSAGRYFYPKGSVSSAGVNIGGRLVGAAQLASMGLARGGGAAVAGVAARGVGLLGSIAGIFGRAIPILGGILLAVEVLKMLGLNFEAKSRGKETDPLIAEYYKNLDEAYYGRSMGTNQSYLHGQKNQPGSNIPNFKQNININIDGKTAMTQTLEQKLNDQLNAGLNFSLKQ